MKWHGKWNHTLNTFKDCQTEKELSSRKLVAKTRFLSPALFDIRYPFFLSWWCIRCLWKPLHRYNWKSVTLMPCNTFSPVSQNEPSALSMVPFIAVLMPPVDNVGFSVVSSSLAWNLGQNRKYIWRKGASTGVFHCFITFWSMTFLRWYITLKKCRFRAISLFVMLFESRKSWIESGKGKPSIFFTSSLKESFFVPQSFVFLFIIFVFL